MGGGGKLWAVTGVAMMVAAVEVVTSGGKEERHVFRSFLLLLIVISNISYILLTLTVLNKKNHIITYT